MLIFLLVTIRAGLINMKTLSISQSTQIAGGLFAVGNNPTMTGIVAIIASLGAASQTDLPIIQTLLAGALAGGCAYNRQAGHFKNMAVSAISGAVTNLVASVTNFSFSWPNLSSGGTNTTTPAVDSCLTNDCRI